MWIKKNGKGSVGCVYQAEKTKDESYSEFDYKEVKGEGLGLKVEKVLSKEEHIEILKTQKNL